MLLKNKILRIEDELNSKWLGIPVYMSFSWKSDHFLVKKRGEKIDNFF